MKIVFLTIVLDGMPWIATHLPVFNRLRCDWEWHIVEGVAKNVGCTSWCKPIKPRLSNDGTTEFLNAIRSHPRVRIYQKESWNGKLEMVNTPLQDIKEECLLWEVDSDELWRSDQIETVRHLFEANQDVGAALFWCRYFVGPNLVISNRNVYGNHNGEWRRCWRFTPGKLFTKHEPPEFPITGTTLSQDEMEGLGIVFDHYAWALPKHVQLKEEYYGYSNAFTCWRRLQDNTNWPCSLKDFLPWVKDEAIVNRL